MHGVHVWRMEPSKNTGWTLSLCRGRTPILLMRELSPISHGPALLAVQPGSRPPSASPMTFQGCHQPQSLSVQKPQLHLMSTWSFAIVPAGSQWRLSLLLGRLLVARSGGPVRWPRTDTPSRLSWHASRSVVCNPCRAQVLLGSGSVLFSSSLSSVFRFRLQWRSRL
jgi:hypothetical protein